MINVGICDDEECTRREIREICGELAGDLGFQDGNEVITMKSGLMIIVFIMRNTNRRKRIWRKERLVML